MTARWTIPAFSGYGIELEYAIVDRDSLAVRPVAAELLRAFGGHSSADVDDGQVGWSHELVAHVVEVKNIAPTPDLEALSANFQWEIHSANRVLERIGACLLPTGMHPWMYPRDEAVLWNEDDSDIYRTYDRIFDCRRHGWSNIQSMHINLPFSDDGQFARLHAAIRLVLPLLPALAASSPIVEGRDTGLMDYRLEAYRANARCVPAVAGKVIPETVLDRTEYERHILDPMYIEIGRHDPAGILRQEWLNSRGAIARFERNAIEVRLADTQECPQADVAIAAATAAIIKALYLETWSSLGQQQAIATDALYQVLLACTRAAEEAVIDDAQLLDVLGLRPRRCRAVDIWQHLIEAISGGSEDGSAWWRSRIAFILERGTLARRILRAINGDFSRACLREVYRRLCLCLDHGQVFEVTGRRAGGPDYPTHADPLTSS
jgi:gamma-glutamyl:cysteine ligase YbdK (ATP-grasp superfamily)